VEECLLGAELGCMRQVCLRAVLACKLACVQGCKRERVFALRLACMHAVFVQACLHAGVLPWRSV
jgi:hypothetical protein